jgi:hypothetical protein
MGKHGRTIKERLLDGSEYQSNGCWIWKMNCRNGGYGTLKVDGMVIAAHRLSAEVWIADRILEKHEIVCHKCDNKLCINPDHLFIGTNRDNTLNMIRKGRRKAPVMRTMEEKKEIKRLLSIGTSYGDIRKIHNVDWCTLSRVANDYLWKSI